MQNDQTTDTQGADENPSPETITIEAHELEALQAELAEVRDERLRERADLENQRRRMSRELDQARRFANERLLGALLPVFDSLEAGLGVESDDVEKLREGMRLTLRQLGKVAEESGLHQIDPAGAAFDPDRHQAISTVPTSDAAPDTVMQVYQKGYVLNERLLRPALVVVAKAAD